MKEDLMLCVRGCLCGLLVCCVMYTGGHFLAWVIFDLLGGAR